MSYLEEAAALLRRSMDAHEKYHEGLDMSKRSNLPKLAQHRQEIAEAFGRLAAIEKGLIPAEWLGVIIHDATSGGQR